MLIWVCHTILAHIHPCSSASSRLQLYMLAVSVQASSSDAKDPVPAAASAADTLLQDLRAHTHMPQTPSSTVGDDGAGVFGARTVVGYLQALMQPVTPRIMQASSTPCAQPVMSFQTHLPDGVQFVLVSTKGMAPTVTGSQHHEAAQGDRLSAVANMTARLTCALGQRPCPAPSHTQTPCPPFPTQLSLPTSLSVDM